MKKNLPIILRIHITRAPFTADPELWNNDDMRKEVATIPMLYKIIIDISKLPDTTSTNKATFI